MNETTTPLANAAAVGAAAAAPAVDPNTMIAELPSAAPTPRADAVAADQRSYVDEWDKAQDANAPVRTWVDPSARATPDGDYMAAWYDTPVAAPSGLPEGDVAAASAPSAPIAAAIAPAAPVAPAAATPGSNFAQWFGDAGPGEGAGGPGDGSGIGSASSATGADGSGVGTGVGGSAAGSGASAGDSTSGDGGNGSGDGSGTSGDSASA